MPGRSRSGPAGRPGRLLRPLGLTDTAIKLSPDQQARAAQGHDARGVPTPPWSFQSLAGAGAFTIAGLGGAFLTGIEGDPGTVVGLSLPLLRRLLAEVDLSIVDLWTKVAPGGQEIEHLG